MTIRMSCPGTRTVEIPQEDMKKPEVEMLAMLQKGQEVVSSLDLSDGGILSMVLSASFRRLDAWNGESESRDTATLRDLVRESAVDYFGPLPRGSRVGTVGKGQFLLAARPTAVPGEIEVSAVSPVGGSYHIPIGTLRLVATFHPPTIEIIGQPASVPTEEAV